MDKFNYSILKNVHQPDITASIIASFESQCKSMHAVLQWLLVQVVTQVSSYDGSCRGLNVI